MGKEQELLDAARTGNLAVIEKILNTKKKGPLLASLRRVPSVNFQDSSGYTALHHAVLNCHKDVVDALLKSGASANTPDYKGSTPLHLAAWTGGVEIVKMLLEDASVPTDVNASSDNFDTALHCAAQYGHTEVVRLLLQHEADPLIRNIHGELAIDLASLYGRTETVEQLVEWWPLAPSSHYPSALHLAARNGHMGVVKLLLDSGADINLVTNSGSVLHEASITGKVDVAKLLLDYGIDVDLKDCHNRTVIDLLKELRNDRSFRILNMIQESPCLMSSSQSLPSHLPEMGHTPQMDHRQSSIPRPSKPPRQSPSPLSKSTPSIAPTLPKGSSTSSSLELLAPPVIGVSSFDETAAWDEIDSIMEACDKDLKGYSSSNEVVCIESNQEAKDVIPACLEHWLESQDMAAYLTLFLIHGFDDLDFMKCLDETDLVEMGVLSCNHRDTILYHVEQLPDAPPIELDSPQLWLRSLRLEQYLQMFIERGFNTMSKIANIWEVELHTVLGIYKLGHRKRILASIPFLKKSFLQLDLNKLQLELDDLESPQEELWLRPPNHLLVNPTGFRERRHWRHPPQQLILRTCDYKVKYLGSSLVKELKGMESTRKAINRQRQARTLEHVPWVTLAISCKGVKFIDPKTKKTVCDHNIRNINCAGQDPEQMNYFAYITKDSHHRHFCHVFGVHNLELATEIILTLGEAFEVAYQLAIQRGSSSS